MALFGGFSGALQGIAQRQQLDEQRRREDARQSLLNQRYMQERADRLAQQDIQNKRLSEQLALQQNQEQRLANKYTNDLTRQARSDYTDSVMGRLLREPTIEGRKKLLSQIQATEGGFNPTGSQLSTLSSLLTPPKQDMTNYWKQKNYELAQKRFKADQDKQMSKVEKNRLTRELKKEEAISKIRSKYTPDEVGGYDSLDFQNVITLLDVAGVPASEINNVLSQAEGSDWTTLGLAGTRLNKGRLEDYLSKNPKVAQNIYAQFGLKGKPAKEDAKSLVDKMLKYTPTKQEDGSLAFMDEYGNLIDKKSLIKELQGKPSILDSIKNSNTKQVPIRNLTPKEMQLGYKANESPNEFY